MSDIAKRMIRKFGRGMRKLFGKNVPVFNLYQSNVSVELNQILQGGKLKVVDVGGAVNLQPHYSKMIGNADFYVFEPDTRSYDDLVNAVGRYSHPADFHYINKALSGKDGKRTLYLSNVPTGTSILKLDMDSPYVSEDSPYLFPMRELEIDTVTIKTALDEKNVTSFDAIKLDVQGAELEIIKGIDDRRMDELNAIEMEIGLHTVYQEQTTFRDAEDYMRTKGFGLFDLRVNRSHLPDIIDNFSYQEKYFGTHDQTPSVAARLWEFDAIFFREPHWISQNLFSKERILKIISLYCVYNFFGEAMQTLNQTFERGILDIVEHKTISDAIISWNKKEQYLTSGFESDLKTNNYTTWAQYMWVPYPSN